MPPRRAVAPSPARSTRSTRSRRGEDDDWENESIQSSFKKTSKSKNAKTLVGLTDTSVNVAAAFHAAQNGHIPPPSAPSRKGLSPPPQPYERQKSPAQILASSARALSPVRFFLRPGDEEDDYPSFSSLAEKSAETSYDYRKEEDFVRAQESKSKAKKGRNGDMPYRPAEDDWEPGSEESGGEGEGIVRGGGLEGRARTRGTRKEQGEGYLGMGLGLRQRRHEEEPYRELTPMSIPDIHSPARSHRSPTPVQIVSRALSPMIDRRKKRQPSSTRTAITNLLHGLVLALKFVCEAAAAIVHGLIIRPIRALFGSSKKVADHFKRNWWKWLLGMLGLSLFFKILDAAWQARAPLDVPPRSVEELVERLSHLEKAVAMLSDSSNLLAEAEREGKKTDDILLSRIVGLEKLSSGMETVQTRVAELNSRIDAKSTGRPVDLTSLERDVRGLRDRINTVEERVKTVLEDGRLRHAMERILPQLMPVRVKGGAIDIDPSFWTEMRKTFVGKSDIDSMVRSALEGEMSPNKDIDAWGERFIERKTQEGMILSRADFTRLLENEVVNLKEMMQSLPRASVVKGGNDITSLLKDLIDAALLKYSKDTIARPDYALFTAGARVIPSITSDTLVMSSPGIFARTVMGKKPVEGRSPATALHPDISVGSCWPFAGSSGQIGILLNRRVKISDVTLEHAAKEVALDTSTAPKDIEVWAVIEGDENKAKAAELQGSVVDHLQLGSFTYDPKGASHIQTFPIDPKIANLDIDVGIVIFKIISNWGGDFTCLYRVRVHGENL